MILFLQSGFEARTADITSSRGLFVIKIKQARVGSKFYTQKPHAARRYYVM